MSVSNERTPITIEDLYTLGWIESPRFSPDGRAIAYVHVTPDRVGNTYRRAIWLAPTDGSKPRRLTAGTKSDSSPRWSPDSRHIVFVSNRDGGAAQLYVIAVDGGEARQLTSLPQGASDPAWSPDGRRIAFLSMVNEDERAREDAGITEPAPDNAWEAQQVKARREYEEQQRFDPRVHTRLPYRSGTSFFDDRRNHIYLIDLPEDLEDEIPPPRRLTDGDLHYGAPVWMPDNSALLTTATRDPEADSLFAYYDLLRIPVPETGRGEPQRLTEPGYSYYEPLPSPDGAWIAMHRLSEERPLAVGASVVILPANGGELRELTANADLHVEQHRWHPSGQAILFSAGWRGEQPIYSVGISGASKHEQVFPAQRRICSEFDIGPDGSVAFVGEAPDNPVDLYLRRPDGTEVRLTAINERLLSQRLIAPIEELLFQAPDGREVQGWVVRPPAGVAPEGPLPLAVHIHGGPHVMWGPGYRSMWHEWQANAARGYVVFFCNPRGSEGYGEAWRDAIHANWGVADSPDIHAGIDAVLAQGGIDPKRIAVTGGSYGGYMTAWLIAHSDRFACAVAVRGVYNLLTEHSTSDAHELIEFEFDDFPWNLHEKLWQHSPLAHAHRINTPLRILHSELDYRVPISEAEQLFAILRRRKQVVEFVRYPREGHELTRSGEPRHRVDHMKRTFEWFDRYCMPS